MLAESDSATIHDKKSSRDVIYNWTGKKEEGKKQQPKTADSFVYERDQLADAPDTFREPVWPSGKALGW